MDSVDIVDDVNALLKLGVGDTYRLEHIKQAYIENKTIWITDNNYLKRMKAKYLTIIHSDAQADIDENLENDSENKELIHCWKCGKKNPLGANFCMACGTSIFEVGTNPQPHKENRFNSKSQPKPIRLKIPIMVSIPVLILIILGVGYSQGSLDNVLERQVLDDTIENKVDSKDSSSKEVLPTESNSKCGAGTIFDEGTNSCVLEKESSQTESNSKCGAGTIFDEGTNSCVLEK